MFGLKKKDRIEFSNVADGQVIELQNYPDEMFSKKLMGDGYAVIPTNGKFYAPISGEIMMVFPSGHAIGLQSKNGVEILIHIGIDTVGLDGKGFDVKVKQGDKVKRGDLLVIADLEYIKNAGLNTATAIVFTSGEKVTVLDSNHQHVATDIVVSYTR